MEILDVHLEPTVSDCMKIANWSKPKGFKVVKKFSDEYNGNAKVGDLFLVQSGRFGYRYYHAGVCCSEKGPEIIQFMANSSGSFSNFSSGASVSSSSSIPCPGLVNKVYINGFSSGSKYAIYRLKMGISDSFQDRVDEAMSKMNKYKLLSYNCIHFALELIYGKELEKKENDAENLIEQFFG
ncbi:hypothetical protein HF521_009942 [Silurus meridionalis]|uniref:LRAT domain-containing protein n=2 Tax=Silurus meridionalis TaxID=175797 RepID=A0A8T0AII7_SILME|nr:hypothetical protein HF521_009942 [Silurus meridionalis]